MSVVFIDKFNDRGGVVNHKVTQLPYWPPNDVLGRPKSNDEFQDISVESIFWKAWSKRYFETPSLALK